MSGPLNFIVASPHLQHGTFVGSVVLLLEHDGNGALGLIVNKPHPQRLEELLEELPGQSGSALRGGPVDPSLGWCLYQSPVALPDEVRLVDGLMMSSSMDVLRAVMHSGQPFLLALGYAGWSAGQLEEEAREGTWVWMEQWTPDLLWQVGPEQRWAEAWKRIGVKPGEIVAGGAQA